MLRCAIVVQIAVHLHEQLLQALVLLTISAAPLSPRERVSNPSQRTGSRNRPTADATAMRQIRSNPQTKCTHLLMKGVDVFRLVQWDESLAQEVFVLLLQRQSKAIDDAAENLQQLGHPIMLTVFIPAKS